MRKLFPMLLFTLLLALLMAVPALAADFTYDDFSATLTVPDSYTMVTTSNLADHEDLLAKQGLTGARRALSGVERSGRYVHRAVRRAG